MALRFGSFASRIPPRFYPWGFISADFVALLLQSAGGGIAASADDDLDLQEVGDGLMIAGVVFQVVTLAVFGAMIIGMRAPILRESIIPKKNAPEGGIEDKTL